MSTTWSGLLASVAEQSSLIEAQGRIPSDVVEALRSHGAFHLTFPEALGGLALSPVDAYDLIEQVSAADGSVGWCVAQSSAAGLLLARADRSVARDITKDRAIFAGVLAPRGAVKLTEDGGLLAGRWPLASGCLHADVLGLGVVVMENGQARRSDGGRIDAHVALVDRCSLHIDETWDSLGLVGTGSHDVAADRIPVAFDRVLRLDAEPRWSEPWLRAPVLTMFPAVIAAVAVGIANRALTDFRELRTNEKRRPTANGGIEALGRVWAHLQTCSSGLRALMSSAADGWKDEADEAAGRVGLRSAVVATVEASRLAVETVFRLSSSSVVLRTSPIQRCFRDIMTLDHHGLLSGRNFEAIGRYWAEDRVLPEGF